MMGPKIWSQLTTYSTYILTLVILIELVDIPIPTFPPLIGETATQLVLGGGNLIRSMERAVHFLPDDLCVLGALDATHRYGGQVPS